MEVVSGNSLLPGDPRLIDHIVCDLKSQGIFDRFRKECIADVDTKPAYQNLRQRVEGSVTSFLKTQQWRPDMNKNQLRESLRKNIYESGFLETGVERIVNQVVNPKINSTFLPEVEDVVYHFLGIEKPQRDNGDKTPSGDGPLTVETTNLLPTDLDPISPDSEVADKSLNKSVTSTEEPEKPDDSKNDEDESPPFEPITEQSFFSTHEDSSNDSHVSGISGLTSHDSNDASSPNETTTKAADLFKLETTNQDSQLSKVSSNSRLSIVTNESKHYSEKMDISDDNTSKSSTKLDGTENGSATAFNMAEINDFKMELEKLKKEEQIKLEPPPNEQIPIIKSEIKLEIKEEISESPKLSDDINKSDRSKPTSSDSRKRSSSSRKDDRKSDRHHKSSSTSSSSKDKHRDKNRDSKSSSSRSKDDASSKSKSSKHSSSSRDRTSSSSKTESTSKTSSSSRSRSSKSKSESSRTRNENGSSRNSKNDDSRSNSQEKRSSSSSKRDDRTKSDEKRKERSRKDEERTKNDEDKLAQEDTASNKEDKAKMDDKLKKTEDKDETMKSKKDDDESKGKKEEKLKKDEDSEDGKGKKEDSRSKRTKTSDDSRRKDETRSKKDDSKSKGSKTSSSSSRSRDSSKHTTRDRKTSSSSSRDHRKDSKKSKQREDMCSSKPTKPETRRSADRDSNDGSSSIGPSTSSNSSKESSTTATKPEQSDSSSSQGTNSGNSTGGQSDQQHQQPPGAPLSDSELTKGFKIVRVDLSGVKVDLTSPPPPNSAQPQIAAHPIPPIVKLNKPRFASNIFEARRLMKVRKRMEKMERKRQIQLELSCAKDRSDTSSLDSVDNELTQIVLDTNCGSNQDDLEKVEENVEKEYGDGELESLLSSTGTNLDENGGAATIVIDSTKMAAPVISKASWDELEAKFNNTVDFDSYADEENSSSNTKSDEDFIGFDTEVTKLIPFKQAVDSYEKSLTTCPLTTPKSAGTIQKTKKMGPPRKILKPPSSSKKTLKPDSSIIIIDSSDDEKPKNTTTPDDLLPGKKGKKRKSFPDLYSENNNKKINNSLTEISGYDPTEYSPSVKIVRNGNIEKTLKTKRLTRSDKAKPTHSSPATDTFPLPLSPESDISASSVDVKKPLEEIVIRPKRVRLGVRGPKVPATKNQQRYSSDDLYKPRPVVCGTSRRQRKLLNNSDKL